MTNCSSTLLRYISQINQILIAMKSLYTILFLFSSFFSFAQLNSFVGTGDGDTWNDPMNWSLGHVPDGEDAEISGWDVSVINHAFPASVTLDGGTLHIESFITLQVTNGFQMSNSSGLEILSDGVLTLGGGININTESGIDNNGTIEINNTTSTAISLDGLDSYIDNSGIIRIGNTGPITGNGILISNEADFGNTGYIYIDDVTGSAIVNDLNSYFSNYANGSIIIGSTATIGDIGIDNRGGSNFDNNNLASIKIDRTMNRSVYNRSGSTFSNNSYTFEMGLTVPGKNNLTNEGTFINDIAGVIEVNNTNHPDGAVLNSASGTFKGVGSVNIVGWDMTTSGDLVPGFSPGKINISGNLVHTATAEDFFELAGTNGPGVANGHDQVNTTNGGDLTLNGTLYVNLLGGFHPNPYDLFVIFNYSGNLIDTFDAVLFPAPQMVGWKIDYGVLTPGKVTLYGPSAALPVELLSFKAIKKRKEILLSWQTASEQNSDYFAVERSTDRREFTDIGHVNAMGTSMETHNYSLTDKNPATGINYYRLKQMDRDGHFTLSKIISVDYDRNVLSFYPNPATKTLFFNKAIEAISIRDIRGKEVLHLENIISDIDISSLQPGMYIVNVNHGAYRERLVLE